LIYWSTTNLWTLGQQFYVIKRNPTPGSPAYEELQAKRAAKGLDGAGSNTQNSDGNSSTENGAPEAPNTRQRQQPKKKKKK